MAEKALVEFAKWNGVKRISLKNYRDVAALLEILLSNGYTAVVQKDEFSYVIEYDWKDLDWCDHTPMWVDPNWVMMEDIPKIENDENWDIE